MLIDAFFSAKGIDIVTQPYLVDTELAELARGVSEDYIRHIIAKRPLLAQQTPVVLEILNGGRYYFLPAAYRAVVRKSCSVRSLRAARRQIGGSGGLVWQNPDSDWRVQLSEMPQKLPEGPIMIGDTIATGTTLAAVMDHLLDIMARDGQYRDVYVFTLAGATSYADGSPGVAKLLERPDEILRSNGCQIHLSLANGSFGLQPNGTDLAFIGAELLPEAQKRVEAKIPRDYLASMKCAIWDWGDRFRNIKKHLEEVREWHAAQKNCPAWIMQGVEDRIADIGAIEPCPVRPRRSRL